VNDLVLNIKQVDHLVLRVVDVEAMMSFYVDVIGCSVEKTQQEAGLYQLRAGSSLIDLVLIDERPDKFDGVTPEKEGRNLDHFCLSIDPFDTDEVIRYLKSKGINPGKVESRYGAEGDGPSIYITDPEGNVVELKGPPWHAAGT
jgi:catechol-2,3-dioxygenase